MFKNFGKLLSLAGLVAGAALAIPIDVAFTGVNGTAAFGYYVGPYYAELETESVSIYCDDFANEVSFGQKWQANLTTITSGSDLSNTRYGGVADALQKYQEIAWLDTQFAVQPTTQYGDIHATIWDFFDPQQAPTPSSDYWLQMAKKNYQSINYDNFRIVTNVGPVKLTGQVQEFVTILSASTPVTTTPEPGPALLVGAGLLGCGALLWKRKQKPGCKPVRFGTD